jgi:hypothetical protein
MMCASIIESIFFVFAEKSGWANDKADVAKSIRMKNSFFILLV